MFKKLSFIICFFSSVLVHAGALDSLKLKLDRAKNDSARIDIYYRAACFIDIDKRISDSLIEKIGTYTTSKTSYVRFFSYYKIGSFYAQRDQPNKALTFLIKALSIADSCNDKIAIMLVRYRLAFTNKITENYKAAIYNAHLSLTYARPLKDSLIIADNYTLIGNIYKSELLLDSALSYHYAALAIREKQKNQMLIALTYNNLALVYKNKKDYQKALSFMRKCIAIKQQTKDRTLASSYNNLSNIFKYLELYDSSVFYSRKVIEYAVKKKNSSLLRESISSLAEVYEAKKDIPNAFYYYKRLRLVEDSINRDVIDKQYQELQSKYESDKKDSELKQKENNLKVAAAENSRKNILILLSSVALILAIVAAVIIFRYYRQSKKTSKELSLKNKLIEEKNKEIMDSINYAQSIQQSLLTSEQIFKNNLKDHFILFKPKDIVSGDFYWAEKINNEFMIMCADCTGHGVPGAFMSLLGISYLREIIYNQAGAAPNIVLNELRKRLIQTFEQKSNKDGMDASLIKIKGHSLEVASANNPLWIIRNNEVIVLNADKFPVGKHYGEEKPFTLQNFDLKANDLLILFTDGYADQFGGPNNKKFKYKKLQQLIVKNSQADLLTIKTKLLQELQSWQGSNEQVDDILLLGIRI